MKEFGIKIKDKEIGNMFSKSIYKIKETTQEFMLMSYKETDYIPFLRKDGVYLPIKYTRLINCKSFEKTTSTDFENGLEVHSNEFKTPELRTIQFVIQEL